MQTLPSGDASAVEEAPCSLALAGGAADSSGLGRGAGVLGQTPRRGADVLLVPLGRGDFFQFTAGPSGYIPAPPLASYPVKCPAGALINAVPSPAEPGGTLQPRVR